MTTTLYSAIILIRAAEGEPQNIRLTPATQKLEISSDPIQNLQRARAMIDAGIDEQRRKQMLAKQ